MPKICKHEGCSNPVFSNNLCKYHTQPKKKISVNKPVKSVSKKQETVNREYTRLRTAFLEKESRCRVCLQPATDIHHAKGRGIHTLDTTTWVPLCREHHNFVHANEKLVAERYPELFKMRGS
jgi:hypothetical protein